MRKKATLGIATFALGALMVGISFYEKRTVLSADTVSQTATRTIAVSLFLGIALIILSALLFIKASGENK